MSGLRAKQGDSLLDSQCSDPFAKGGDRHGFWWADATYLRPGLHFRSRRVVAFSLWILRPRYSWRTRGV